MLCLVGVSSKEYIKDASRSLHRRLDLSCPDPDCAGARLVGHGCYRRYLGGELQEIARVCCRRCGVTHGLLPSDACAYRDLTLGSLESVWDAEGLGSAVRQQDPPDVCTHRTMRSVLRQIAVAGVSLLGFLPALPSGGLRELRAVFGPSCGVLLRVREWLWSRYGYWFSGLSGLWRHGRPPHLDRRRSTDLGSCSRG